MNSVSVEEKKSRPGKSERLFKELKKRYLVFTTLVRMLTPSIE